MEKRIRYDSFQNNFYEKKNTNCYRKLEVKTNLNEIYLFGIAEDSLENEMARLCSQRNENARQCIEYTVHIRVT